MNDVRLRAATVVAEIVDDLYDRQGLGDEWDQITDDVRDEIIDTWRSIVAKALRGKGQ